MLRAALVAMTLAQNVRPPEGGSQPDSRVEQAVTIYKVGGLAAKAADCAEVTFQPLLPSRGAPPPPALFDGFALGTCTEHGYGVPDGRRTETPQGWTVTYDLFQVGGASTPALALLAVEDEKVHKVNAIPTSRDRAGDDWCGQLSLPPARARLAELLHGFAPGSCPASGFPNFDGAETAWQGDPFFGHYVTYDMYQKPKSLRGKASALVV